MAEGPTQRPGDGHADEPHVDADAGGPSGPDVEADTGGTSHPDVDAEPVTEDRPTIGPELADQREGRWLITLVVVTLLAAMLISNLPSSPLTDELTAFEQPITDLTGLSQNWALFAPRPRSTTLRLRAELEHADGSVTEWIPPVGDRFIGVYATYRWRKWSSAVVTRDRVRLHRETVDFLAAWARRELPDAPPVVEVRLFRGVATAAPPGSGEPLDRDPDLEEELLMARSLGEPGS